LRNGGRALTELMLNLQAQIIAFSHHCRLVMIVTLCAIPLTLMIGSRSPRCAGR
jgi:MFS transporter, DHA2 family, multidrug resistance protein